MRRKDRALHIPGNGAGEKLSLDFRRDREVPLDPLLRTDFLEGPELFDRGRDQVRICAKPLKILGFEGRLFARV